MDAKRRYARGMQMCRLANNLSRSPTVTIACSDAITTVLELASPKSTMFYLRTFILLAFLFLSWITTASAQWTQIASFPSWVRTIHFVEGQSQIGYVGTADGEVFKTTDQGST